MLKIRYKEVSMMPEELLIASWFKSFESTPVYPRAVLEHAIEHNKPLLTGILETTGIDPTHPHPDALSAWLCKNENRFVSLNDGTYRFSRFGHRWRLLRSERVAA